MILFIEKFYSIILSRNFNQRLTFIKDIFEIKLINMFNWLVRLVYATLFHKPSLDWVFRCSYFRESPHFHMYQKHWYPLVCRGLTVRFCENMCTTTVFLSYSQAGLLKMVAIQNLSKIYNLADVIWELVFFLDRGVGHRINCKFWEFLFIWIYFALKIDGFQPFFHDMA